MTDRVTLVEDLMKQQNGLSRQNIFRLLVFGDPQLLVPDFQPALGQILIDFASNARISTYDSGKVSGTSNSNEMSVDGMQIIRNRHNDLSLSVASASIFNWSAYLLANVIVEAARLAKNTKVGCISRSSMTAEPMLVEINDT